MLGWRGDPGGTLDALSSSPRLQNHQVPALILVTGFAGTYSHISTFLSLSFSSFKTGHLAGLILEVLSHTDICASERAPGNPCRTREWSTSQRGPEGGWGLRGYCPGWCRVAASVPECGFAGLCQARGSSALYNKPADRSQSREFFSPSTDAFTPTQAPARKREKKI